MVIKRKFFAILFIAAIMLFAVVAGVMPRAVRAEGDAVATGKTFELKTDVNLAEPDVIIVLGEGWDDEYDLSAKQGDVDIYSRYKGSYWMQFDSPILKVYDVTFKVKGSDEKIININDKVVITLRVPDEVVGQKFDIRRCNYTFQKEAEKLNYTLSSDGKYATFTTNEMREFMIVCDGESFLVPIIIIAVLIVAEVVLLILQIRKKIKKRKEEEAKRNGDGDADGQPAETTEDIETMAAFAPLMLTFFAPSHMILFVILSVAFVALAILNIIFFTIGRNIPSDDEEENEEEEAEEEEEEQQPEKKPEAKPEPKPEVKEQKAEESPQKPEPVKEPEPKPEPEPEVKPAPAVVPQKKEVIKTVAPVPATPAKKSEPKFSPAPAHKERSFLAKLIQSPLSTKQQYSAVKNRLLSIRGSESRVSWTCDVIATDERKLAEIHLKGGEIYCLFALGENGKMLKADVTVGINALCRKYGVEWGEKKRDNYLLPYLDDAELEKRGLIR